MQALMHIALLAFSLSGMIFLFLFKVREPDEPL